MKDVILLSKYVINKFNNDNAPITNLKLQKVLYYIQGYFCRNFTQYAFEDDFYCWQYGPVVPSVYYEYHINGPLPLVCEQVSIPLKDCEKALIDKIIERCKSFKSFELVEMTHKEAPWVNTVRGNIIEKKAIQDFFYKNNPLEIKND